ncbi:hypothetical protein ECC07_01610 [Helicobacter pylori]|nr:hypothetical protein ECC07_01610 [Helicobacter pylori]
MKQFSSSVSRLFAYSLIQFYALLFKFNLSNTDKRLINFRAFYHAFSFLHPFTQNFLTAFLAKC